MCCLTIGSKDPDRVETMKAALGLKAHSGWAAQVVLGTDNGDIEILERRRVELVEGNAEWAKQPYHAAEGLSSNEARTIVKRGIDSAHRLAIREMRAAVKRANEFGYQLSGCGVLVVDPMPDWSVDQILAVHFRMHKAEGVLFREALAKAVVACKLRLVAIPEKTLLEHAQKELKASAGSIQKKLAALGKVAGPPWGKDQKDAALAAMVALGS
jgi:hypothetical protein